MSRTLVKSPPELWEELQGERLPEAVGCDRVNVAEAERRIEWEADGARGAAVLQPAGWGTKLTLIAELPDEELAVVESEVAKLGVWARLRGVKPPPAPEPEPPRSHELERAFEQLLDDLGSAHRKPFQLG
ncbi:MAG TPA: hypothetical protein VI111_01800 [Thermoleophilaceae bacterium]